MERLIPGRGGGTARSRKKGRCSGVEGHAAVFPLEQRRPRDGEGREEKGKTAKMKENRSPGEPD